MSSTPNISDLAYRLWEEDGRPHGRDVDFWLQAEQQLTTQPPKAKKPRAAAKPKSKG